MGSDLDNNTGTPAPNSSLPRMQDKEATRGEHKEASATLGNSAVLFQDELTLAKVLDGQISQKAAVVGITNTTDFSDAFVKDVIRFCASGGVALPDFDLTLRNSKSTFAGTCYGKGCRLHKDPSVLASVLRRAEAKK